MTEQSPYLYLYWVCFILQHDGKIAFQGQPLAINHPIDSPEMIDEMVHALIEEHVDFDPEPGVPPLVPVTWHLVSDMYIPPGPD